MSILVINGQILPTNGQIVVISEFSWQIEYNFPGKKHIITRPSMIGSPEGVKIQRSSVQNLSKIQQRLKIIGCFLTFWGLKYPRGSQQILGVKKHQK